MVRRLVIDDTTMTVLCDIIGDWYLEWKDKMTDDKLPHRLGISREDLKRKIEAAREGIE